MHLRVRQIGCQPGNRFRIDLRHSEIQTPRFGSKSQPPKPAEMRHGVWPGRRRSGRNPITGMPGCCGVRYNGHAATARQAGDELAAVLVINLHPAISRTVRKKS